MRIVERVPSVRSTSMDRQSRDRDPDSTNQPELVSIESAKGTEEDTGGQGRDLSSCWLNLISLATWRSWLPSEVFGKTVFRDGLVFSDRLSSTAAELIWAALLTSVGITVLALAGQDVQARPDRT